MSLPAPPFPVYQTTLAFRALEEVLRRDEVLKRAVKTWSTWDGARDDIDNPVSAMMPYIQLTPAMGSIRYAEVESYEQIFRVRVAICVQGRNVDHLMNFWGAIMSAVSARKPFRDKTVRTFLKESGAYVFEVSGPGDVPSLYGGSEESPPGDLMGVGAITLKLFVPS